MDPQEQFYLPKGTIYKQNFHHREIKTDEVAVGCVISFGMSLSEFLERTQGSEVEIKDRF